jgi:hypothetical protein
MQSVVTGKLLVSKATESVNSFMKIFSCEQSLRLHFTSAWLNRYRAGSIMQESHGSVKIFAIHTGEEPARCW